MTVGLFLKQPQAGLVRK